MKTFSLNYPTVTNVRNVSGKVFVLEAIRNLDEAIDLICETLTPDEQLDPFAEDLCPYFGVLWPAAEGLARYLERNPLLIKGKRVLELGCGLGLPSLVASHLGGEVLATDFHPDVESYFLRNCRHSSVSCKYERLNWRSVDAVERTYDIVIGSDLLYEPKHPLEVVTGLLKFVSPGGTIILSDPGRNYLEKFIDAMTGLGHQEEVSLIPIENREIIILKYNL